MRGDEGLKVCDFCLRSEIEVSPIREIDGEEGLLICVDCEKAGVWIHDGGGIMNKGIYLQFYGKGWECQEANLFIKGANCGKLRMAPEAAVCLSLVLQEGCKALDIPFETSGPPKIPENNL